MANDSVNLREDSQIERDRRITTWHAPVLDLLCVFVAYWKLMLLIAALGLAVGFAMSSRTAPFYRASTVAILLPREKPTVDVTLSSSSTETTDDSARRSDAGSLMLPPQTELYMAMLDSRSVLEQLATTFTAELNGDANVAPPEHSDNIVSRVRRMISVEGTEEGLLTITVTADDPQFAADFANAAVDEIQNASKAIERQLLAQQAGYLERAVEEAAVALERDEERFRLFCTSNGLINPATQADDRMRQIRDLTAMRDRANSEIAQLSRSLKSSHPRIQALRSEVEYREARIDELRAAFAGRASESDYSEVASEYESLVQQVRFRRDLHTTLTTQADVFRIRAAQPAGNIAVVRPAVPIDTPAGPRRKRILAMSVAVSLIGGVGLVLFTEQTRTAVRNPDLAPQVRFLRRLGRGPRPAEHATA